MRMLACGLAAVLACSVATAADDDLDKAIVGKWKIKTAGVEEKNVLVEQTIEFTKDGSYTWMIGKKKLEGAYKLNGTTVEMKPKTAKSTTIWKEAAIKDGKLVTGTPKLELTRIDEKDK
jgi:hypothetical protein